MKKRMTHKFGWMAMLPSGQTYRWHFDGVAQITNISYDSTFYGFKVSHMTHQNKAEVFGLGFL